MTPTESLYAKAAQVSFGLIVTSKEVRSGSDVMTPAGAMFWVLVEPGGWVDATSGPVLDRATAPAGLKIFATEAEAKTFGKRWKGHPWWCCPASIEVVPLSPRMVTVQDGWVLRP